MTETDQDIDTIRQFGPECFIESREIFHRKDGTCWIATTVSFDIRANIKSNLETVRPHVTYQFRDNDSQVQTMYKLKENRTYKYDFDASNPNWIEFLITKLQSDTCNDENFEKPKRKTVKSKQIESKTSTPIPTSNSFSALEDNTDQTNETNSFLTSTYKDKLPSVYLPYPNKDRTMLDTLKNTISKDTKFELKGSSLKVQPTSELEFQSIISKANQLKWEYFTHNLYVKSNSKYVLKGLPNTTECDTIKAAFQEHEVHIIHIRQMTKTYKLTNKIFTMISPLFS